MSLMGQIVTYDIDSRSSGAVNNFEVNTDFSDVHSQRLKSTDDFLSVNGFVDFVFLADSDYACLIFLL